MTIHPVEWYDQGLCLTLNLGLYHYFWKAEKFWDSPTWRSSAPLFHLSKELYNVCHALLPNFLSVIRQILHICGLRLDQNAHNLRSDDEKVMQDVVPMCTTMEFFHDIIILGADVSNNICSLRVLQIHIVLLRKILILIQFEGKGMSMLKPLICNQFQLVLSSSKRQRQLQLIKNHSCLHGMKSYNPDWLLLAVLGCLSPHSSRWHNLALSVQPLHLSSWLGQCHWWYNFLLDCWVVRGHKHDEFISRI